MEEEPQIIKLKDDFFRDGFGRVMFIMASFIIAMVLTIGVSVYLYLTIPPPVVFAVDQEWRVQPSVPVDKAYLTDPEVLQWVSDIIPKAFTLDFKNYNDHLPPLKPYFTTGGWTVFLNQLNIYVNYNNVQTDRLFVTAAPSRAPTVLQRGLLDGDRYYWVVELPIEVTYIGLKKRFQKTLMLKVVVVRIPTLANLSGVEIDNLIIDTPADSQPLGSP